jgi:hypothetical protein
MPDSAVELELGCGFVALWLRSATLHSFLNFKVSKSEAVRTAALRIGCYTALRTLSPVALKQEFGTVPENILVFCQDPSVGKIRPVPQPKRPLYCSFVISIRFAIQNRNGIRLIGWRPDQTFGIDEKYRTEVGSLLPAAHALLASTIDCAGKRCDLIFPVLNRGPRNVQVLSRFFLAKT